ncbi:MAG TPA: FAD-dependent oxidoreductase [Myxococcota bacterium]|nr:FAD-dependent oxidoreductase [Myxococcota bacterium]
MYPHLFAPLRIGPLESRNRIVFGAHFTMYSEPAPRWGEPGFYGERLGRYLAERARGGAGVVIAGQAQVHPTTAYQMANNAAAWPDEAVPHLERVARAVHEHGALAFLQLAHNGGVNGGAWSKRPAWAPSSIANYHEPPKALEPEEIRELVEHFARSARNAAAAGFDGIEVHAAHGYLIHEFLSPRSNRRDDRYGGSLENRMRFAVEVLAAVRAAVGPSRAVGVRLVGDEEAGSGGLGPADAAEIAARLEAAGLVDFVNVSVGLSGVGMVRPLYAKPGFGVYAAAAVKERLRGAPVFAVHRIVTPEQAEAILARGEADAVTLVRALIADPDWAAKAHRGAASEIRRCTGNNQGCYGNLLQGLPVTCVQNPAVGREEELGAGTLAPAARRKRVVVVGGGPAGLEAAWVAAARGHEVRLLEREHRLGGKVHAAARLPGRAELIDHAQWRIEECERRGVRVELGFEATRDSVLALEPDAVVVATGGRATKTGYAKWHPFAIAGIERELALDHEEALRRADELVGRIVILDAVGHIEGLGLGELLAARGADVTLATPLASPMLLDAETLAAALPRAVRAGVRWRPTHGLLAIGDREVTLLDLLAARPERIEDVDWVVVRTHGLPEERLYFELKGEVPEVVRVGDAVAVRLLDRAIFDGHAAGRRL